MPRRQGRSQQHHRRCGKQNKRNTKMPKKPPTKNGYALFVEASMKTTRPQGNPYDYFGPAWKALPEYERKKFMDLAKELKYKNQNDLECKFTTSGQSYAEVDRIRREKENKEREMNKDIEETVEALALKNKLAEHAFFLMHVNYYFVSETGVYYPAELSLVRFTLANGVEDFYHKILNPGYLPTGSMSTAMTHSKATHNLPCPPDPKIAEHDFNKIDREIKEFLLGKEGFAEALRKYRQRQEPIVLPPLYTYYSKEMQHYNKENDVVVNSFMHHLPDGTKEKYVIRVYELKKLLYELCNACAQKSGHEYGFPSITIAQQELERDVFSHAMGIACQYHEERDVILHCSLALTKRWSYTLADFCCKHLGIDIIPGAHCPLKAAPYRIIQMPTQQPVTPAKTQPPASPQAPQASAAEVTKRRVPIKEPLKELRQPQASCIDTLAMQFSDKLKTTDKPEGSVMGSSQGVAGAPRVVGAGRGAAVSRQLGLGTASVAVAGRGRKLPATNGN